MRKHMLVALFITCISASCKKEQAASQIENLQKEEQVPKLEESESKLSVLGKTDLDKVYEVKQDGKDIVIFSKPQRLDDKTYYILEDKNRSTHFLIKTFKPISFPKDLSNEKLVRTFSFEDVDGNNYACKISSSKKTTNNARGGLNEPGQFCVDWYWVIFNEKTGEIVAEVYVTTTCYESNGLGGGGSGGGLNNECNLSEDQAEKILDDYQSEALNIIQEIGGGREVADFNGVIRKPKTLQWTYTRIKNPAYGETEWSAYFAGVEFKNGQNDNWKWESFDFSSFAMSGGTIPPCLDVTGSINAISTTIDSDKRLARASLHWSALLNYTCLTTTKVKAMSGSGTADFQAN